MRKRYFINTVNIVWLLLVLQIGSGVSSIAAAKHHILPSAIIKLPENEIAVLVEKKSQTLFVYKNDGQDVSVQFEVPCSTGEAYGTKLKSGDKKTPEGIYFLNDEYEDKYLSPIYGKKAFPTDYPNLIDKRAGKNGSAIWIHGTNKELKPMDSNGCIALENSNILRLSDYVTLHSTPVILVEEMNSVERIMNTRQEQAIDLFLHQWAKSIEIGSYHDYLSFYSPDYLPDISWWGKWFELRKEADKTRSSLELKLDRAGIYYHDDVFVALFDFSLTVKAEKIFLGKRKLFLKRENQTYKIIGDIFQSTPQKFQKASPLIAAANQLVKPVSKTDAVIDTLKQWLAAWSAKDMDTYASFYADDFYSDGMNKKIWVKRKRTLAKKYNFINVSGREFDVKQQKETCEVYFFQEYESSGLTTQGTKRLKLVNKGGSWKIYQESWKEK